MLRDRALEIASRELDRPRLEAIKRIGEAPPAQVAHGFDDVLGAARAGRVAWLLARTEQPAWGIPRGNDHGTELHDARRPGDDDLIDLAIAEALATGAHVASFSEDELATAEPVVALLRY